MEYRGFQRLRLDYASYSLTFAPYICMLLMLFAMTSVCSWQNSVSLGPASFCTPRPNFPVTPGISWLPTFAFQSCMMKRTSFLAVSSRRSCRPSLNHSIQLLQNYWLGHRLGLLWYWMVSLETNRDHSVIFEIASKYCISDSFVNYDGYSISSKGFLFFFFFLRFIYYLLAVVGLHHCCAGFL